MPPAVLAFLAPFAMATLACLGPLLTLAPSLGVSGFVSALASFAFSRATTRRAITPDRSNGPC